MANAAEDVLEPEEREPEGSLLGTIPTDENRRLASWWKTQVQAVDQSQQRWIKRGETINKRYRDERNRIDEEGQRRMNILWATIQTLHPALYGRMPQPIAERKFLDRDPIARVAAQMMQRTLRNEMDNNDFDDSLSSAVLDYLLCGRGQIWVRYEPQIGESVSIPSMGEDDMRDEEGQIERPTEDEETHKLEETGEAIVTESCPVDYVFWKDFYMLPSRSRRWSEVQAVGKRIYMSRNEMVSRFGKKIGNDISLSWSMVERMAQGDVTAMYDSDVRKAEVIEIWDKSSRKVYWVAEGYEYLCDMRDDPLKLTRFFPCPKPLMATVTNDSVIPVPDYLEWQDQAIMVDELTQRISMLAKACKVAGVYSSRETGIKRLLDESVENELLPVDDWAAFAEKGGIEGCVSFLPLKEIIGVLNELIQVRQVVLKDLDQVTGISDILRGTSDARETLGAQRIKSNYSTVRLKKRQKDVANFARDGVKLMSEIISRFFSEETLIGASGALFQEGVGAELSNYYQQSLFPPEIPAQLPGPSPMQPGPTPGPQAPGQPPGAPPAAPPSPMGNVVPFPGPQVAAGGPQGAPPGQLALPPPGSMMGAGAPPASSGASSPTQGAIAGGVPPSPPGQSLVPFQPPGMPTPFQNPALKGGVPSGLLASLGDMMGLPGIIPGTDGPAMTVLMRIAKAILLLRKDRQGFRIDIETDSTVEDETETDREMAIEFVKQVTMFIQNAGQIALAVPESMAMLGKLLQFGVRRFRVGRDLESTIDEFVDEMTRKAKMQVGQPKPPTPQEVELQTAQVRGQAEIQKANTDAKAREADAQFEGQRQQMEIKKMGLEMERDKQRHNLEMQQGGAETLMKQREIDMKEQHLQLDFAAKQAEHGLKMDSIQRQQQLQAQQHDQAMQQTSQQMAQQAAQHQQTMTQGATEHSQKLEQGAVEHQNTQLKGAVEKQSHEQGMQKTLAEGFKSSTEAAAKSAPKPAGDKFQAGAKGEPAQKPPAPPLHGAKQAPDGNHYVPDPSRPGKYLRVVPHQEVTARQQAEKEKADAEKKRKDEESKTKQADNDKKNAAEREKQRDEEHEEGQKRNQKIEGDLEKISSMVSELLGSLHAPKRIVRDKDGRAVGVDVDHSTGTKRWKVNRDKDGRATGAELEKAG